MPESSPLRPPSVAALLVSHDGARWLPAVIEGIRAQTTPLARVVAVDTGSKDESADLLEQAFGEVERVPGGTGYPAAVEIGLELLRASGADCEWVWLLHDDANPEPAGAGHAARRGRRESRGRHPRPQAARVAVAASAARGGDHDLRHRAPRDRPRAGRVRPGTARRGADGAGGQHRRDAGPPTGARGARRLRPAAADLRQRPRLRLARGGRRSHHDGGAGRGRLPCRGRAPRCPPDPADRTAHPLPRASGRALHAAGQLPFLGAALPGDPAGVRHRAADDRVPDRPVGG